MTHVKRFSFQKRLLISLLLEDIADSALFTFVLICLVKANLGETLSILSGIRKGVTTLKSSYPPPLSSTLCLDMEQFVLVPASVYNNNNKILTSQEIKKQELPEYQTERYPTYHID